VLFIKEADKTVHFHL